VPFERLAKSKLCRRCGGVIPLGTLLSGLEWEPRERAWAHRKPSCDEVRESASAPPPSSSPAGTRPNGAPVSNGPPVAPSQLGFLDDPTAGS